MVVIQIHVSQRMNPTKHGRLPKHKHVNIIVILSVHSDVSI